MVLCQFLDRRNQVEKKADRETGKNGVFKGENAVRDFLDPDNNPMIPLVEIPQKLNPFTEEGVRIFAKTAYMLPLLNIKSLPALNMLSIAESWDMFNDTKILVENSSGNTGFSLAITAKLFGIKNVVVIVPYDVAPGKLEMLRIAGAEVRFNKGPPEELRGIDLARKIGDEKGFLNLDQYKNEANPAAYEKWLAPQIWKQTDGKISVFCAGLGTTGTLIGTKRYLEKVRSKAKIIGVNLLENNAIPGVRTMAKLEEISFDWQRYVDFKVEIGTKESYKKSLELCRSGLIAGPSSGFTLAGLIKFFNTFDASNLDSLRNSDGEIMAVFVCPDTPFPYLDKYSTILDPEDF